MGLKLCKPPFGHWYRLTTLSVLYRNILFIPDIKPLVRHTCLIIVKCIYCQDDSLINLTVLHARTQRLQSRDNLGASVRPRPRERESCREEVLHIYRCYVYVLLSECRLVCHLPSTSALVPNDGGVQRANYPHSGASPQASATSLHQGLPSSRFTLGPFQRHTHTHMHRANDK